MDGQAGWNFDVDAQGLAISDLRPGVEGRISAKGTIAGTGLSAAAPWTARLTSLSGTLFGRPLTGRGEINHRDGVFDLRNVRIANGESFADINGRVGADALDLKWNVDLRSLAIAVPGMAGTLVSRGTASGTPQRPVIVGRARVRQFDYAGVQVATLTPKPTSIPATSALERSPSVPATIDAAGMAFDFVRGSLDGLLGEHRIRSTSPRLAIPIAASRNSAANSSRKAASTWRAANGPATWRRSTSSSPTATRA